LAFVRLFLLLTFADEDTFPILPEGLCGHVFRLGLAPYNPGSIAPEFS